jgi:hypothetical protein
MTAETATLTSDVLATIDVRELNTLRWGILRAMFPSFADEVELGRFVRTLLGTHPTQAVRIERHRLPDGQCSTHVFDIRTC